MMNSRDYWEMRNAQLLDRADITNKQLAKIYKKANARIEKRVLELWLEMQGKGGITPANLVQIERYVTLQYEIQAELTAMGETVDQKITKSLLNTAGFGSDAVNSFVGSSMVTLSPKVIEQIVMSPYKGDIFSSRIWKNTDRINKVLKSAILDSTVIGEDVRKVSKRVSNIMDVAYNDSKRIVVTETGRVFNEACRLSAKELGFRVYTLILEPTACPKCKEHEKDYYDINQSVLPFHPYCKCSMKIDTNSGIAD